MEFLKSIFKTSTILVGLLTALIVFIILLLLGWKPVSIGVDAGPFSIEFAQNTPTSTVVVQKTEFLSATPVINPTTTPVSSSGPNVLFSRPKRQDYLRLKNIWDYFDDREKSPTSPTTLLYEVSINSQDEYRWGAVWCGKDEQTLQEIMQPLSMNLLVDGVPLSSNNILELEDTISGWKCHRWVTHLYGWEPGSVIELELSYYLQKSIFDGYEETSAGEYHLIISVKVN